MGSKSFHERNPPILNWRCRLTQVDLYNGHKTMVGLMLDDMLFCSRMVLSFVISIDVFY